MGCVISGSRSPVTNGWIHGDADLPLSFSYVSASKRRLQQHQLPVPSGSLKREAFDVRV
uniref:Uncharacterized protein n=1 Tax=Arundo donax TaxID=35708 RepID=A0A0A9BN82_ARUDO